jgi:hypothetical protein
VPLPGNTFDRAMAAHLDVVERRVRGLYVRPRALFAEAVVAALIDATVVEFPAAAWAWAVSVARRTAGRDRVAGSEQFERARREPDSGRGATNYAADTSHANTRPRLWTGGRAPPGERMSLTAVSSGFPLSPLKRAIFTSTTHSGGPPIHTSTE